MPLRTPEQESARLRDGNERTWEEMTEVFRARDKEVRLALLEEIEKYANAQGTDYEQRIVLKAIDPFRIEILQEDTTNANPD